jgi:WD domain, G-beta repeat.
VVSGGEDMLVQIWNLNEKNFETTLKSHTAGVTTVAVTSDNQYIISAGKDKTIRV